MVQEQLRLTFVCLINYSNNNTVVKSFYKPSNIVSRATVLDLTISFQQTENEDQQTTSDERSYESKR